MAYFSNGSERDVLDEQCDDCHIANNYPCPLLAIQEHYNYKQYEKGKGFKYLRKAMNLLINKNQSCQMKVAIDKIYPEGYCEGEENDTARKILDKL